MTPPILHYTKADSEAAFKEWKAQCGPHSIAAACGLKLSDVRDAIVAAGITHKGWMSPTYVSRTLDQLGRKYTLETGLKTMALCEGINRVQWEGKWLNLGVPARVAYFHTHLVAHFGGWVLCTAYLVDLWIPAQEWQDFHLNCEPKSPFHITHHWTFSGSADKGAK